MLESEERWAAQFRGCGWKGKGGDARCRPRFKGGFYFSSGSDAQATLTGRERAKRRACFEKRLQWACRVSPCKPNKRRDAVQRRASLSRPSWVEVR
ncbi:hypothetical protein L1887_53666 [Cichorium endivia]|nr:hypothetical protein L1887_53666 [Cichorium endivia]